MKIERCFELQDKHLCLENALRHYGMKDESRDVFCILEDLFAIVDKNDTKQAKQRRLKFLVNISTFVMGSTVNVLNLSFRTCR